MPRLEIHLDGHLLISGGHVSNLGIDLAMARRFDQGRWVPYIPATAVRGAIRIQLEALLRGAQQEVAGPYLLDATEPRGDTVSRLFGYSGPEGEPAGSREGLLRFSDALARDPERALKSLSVRTGVEIDDLTASAEDRKLFSRELLEHGEPLVFQCRLEIDREADTEDVARLRRAVETTSAIGAGKSTGGGQVRIEWLEGPEEAPNRVVGEPSTATRARVVCTLLDPVHFGDGGPRGNHHGTRTYLPGSTLRGAIAWALLRHTEVQPEDETFQALFVGPEAASFGDGLATEAGADEPVIRPATLLESREKNGGFEDVLARELARSIVNERLQSHNRYLRADVRHLRPDSLEARPATELVRRVRTRVSIDRYTGTSAHGKLFSIEQIEPWTVSPSGKSYQVKLVAWLEGLTTEASKLLAKIEHVPVYVGAGRNHGMGCVALEVHLLAEPEHSPEMAAAKEKVLRLSQVVEEHRLAMSKRCGLSLEDEDANPLYLALVARSEFLPAEAAAHPLAFCQELAGEPIRSFLNTSHSGGYNQMPGAGREPLKTLRTAIGAGSVFVYRLAESTLRDLLQQALPILRGGVGRRRESGCGRFEIFEEITK